MNLQYELNTPYMCSGDDSLIVGHAKTSKYWQKISGMFKIVSKTEFVSQPLFCGFICASVGIIREPVHFAMKLALAQVSGLFEDVACSYAMEYQLGHKLGGLVDDILNEEQRLAHAVIGSHLYANSPGRVRAMLSTMHLPKKLALLFGCQLVSELKGKTLDSTYVSLVSGLASDCVA